MKKAIGIIALLFISCGAYLTNLGDQYDYKFNFLNGNNDGYTWQDDKISISFEFPEKQIDFKLYNKSQNVIKIIWDNAAFVFNDESKKIIHSGIKYNESSAHQPPTSIPPKSSITDCILPAENIYWQYGSYSGGWREAPIFPKYDKQDKNLKNRIESMKGKKFKVYLPIESGEKTLDYLFEFQIRDVVLVDTNVVENPLAVYLKRSKITKVQNGLILVEGTKKYQVGDKLTVIRGEREMGQVEVLKIKENQTACKIISETERKIKVGDEIK
jgi:hypothetical protein